MAIDLFEFWSRIGLADTVHPDDREVLSRVEHRFNPNCLPSCFMGPLRTAPVVLLFLSPGFTKHDEVEAKSETGRERHMKMRGGLESLPGPDEHQPAWKWWESRTRCFGNWQELRSKVAVLNIGAYHSTTFADAPLLAALPSSRASLDWAQSVLCPQAIDGDRAVICLRSSRFWGLNEGQQYGRSLYAPKVTRAGHMCITEMREVIIRDVQDRLSA